MLVAGKRVYLGRADLPEARMRNAPLLAETDIGERPPVQAGKITVAELVDRFDMNPPRHESPRPDGGVSEHRSQAR